MSEQAASFRYTDLNEIDPSNQALPEDVYTVKVLSAQYVEGIGKTSGQPYEMVKFFLAITDHENYSGRRLWESFFPGNYGAKAMRRIADATGLMQEPGTSLIDWLAVLTEKQPTFKIPVQVVEDLDKDGKARSLDIKGNPAKINKLNWFNVQPA